MHVVAYRVPIFCHHQTFYLTFLCSPAHGMALKDHSHVANLLWSQAKHLVATSSILTVNKKSKILKPYASYRYYRYYLWSGVNCRCCTITCTQMVQWISDHSSKTKHLSSLRNYQTRAPVTCSEKCYCTARYHRIKKKKRMYASQLVFM